MLRVTDEGTWSEGSGLSMDLDELAREAAEEGITRFRDDYGAKYLKAVDSLTRHQEKLLTFFDFPAEHWKHIRTANPVESTFATVRLRQRVTKGPGSRQRRLLMAYKLLRMAEERWSRLAIPAPSARAGRGEVHRRRDGRGSLRMTPPGLAARRTPPAESGVQLQPW